MKKFCVPVRNRVLWRPMRSVPQRLFLFSCFMKSLHSILRRGPCSSVRQSALEKSTWLKINSTDFLPQTQNVLLAVFDAFGARLFTPECRDPPITYFREHHSFISYKCTLAPVTTDNQLRLSFTISRQLAARGFQFFYITYTLF
jgi:hypothetical protein